MGISQRATASLQGCLAVDAEGLGVTAEGQGGLRLMDGMWNTAYGASANVGIRASTSDIEGMNGWSTAYRFNDLNVTVGDDGSLSATVPVYGRGGIAGYTEARKRTYAVRILEWKDLPTWDDVPEYAHVPAARGAPIPLGRFGPTPWTWCLASYPSHGTLGPVLGRVLKVG